MFSKATLKERRQYYREEWSENDLPEFISTDIKKREFGFDHNGTGPNDRYKVFKGKESLRKFLRYKAPFAAYISVAFYNNPRRREDWLKAEYIFDVDAKDIPIRSCQCDSVCEICLGEALEIVNTLIDTLQTDLGLKDIHLIYSGRGYHIRILDEEMMTAGSELRSEVLKYAAGGAIIAAGISLLTKLFAKPEKVQQQDTFEYSKYQALIDAPEYACEILLYED